MVSDLVPYQRHSETSRDAADRVVGHRETLQEQVFNFLQGCGERGATDEEVQVGLGMNPSTERPRRIELVEAGRVEPAGDKRATKSGRSAQVWKVKSERGQMRLL